MNTDTVLPASPQANTVVKAATVEQCMLDCLSEYTPRPLCVEFMNRERDRVMLAVLAVTLASKSALLVGASTSAYSADAPLPATLPATPAQQEHNRLVMRSAQCGVINGTKYQCCP